MRKQIDWRIVVVKYWVVSDSLWPHRLQHARLPCPSPPLRLWDMGHLSCPMSQWCHPTISSSIVRFSSWLQSFPASGSFPMSQLLASGGQSIGASVSAAILPMNIQGWFPLGLIGLISLQSKGLSRVFSRTTVWKHKFLSVLQCSAFFMVQLSHPFMQSAERLEIELITSSQWFNPSHLYNWASIKTVKW